MNIGIIVEEYLKTRGISLIEFSRMLGYRSKTSVVRLMRNQANMRSVEKFSFLFREKGSLTEDELNRLEDAVEKLRWQENYQATRAIHAFLEGESEPDSPIELTDIGNGERCIMFERYSEVQELQILLLNSVDTSIFEQLRRLIAENGASVEHFIRSDGNHARMLQAINMLSPVMYLKKYRGYMTEHGSRNAHAGIQSSDMMYARYVRQGEVREDLIVFTEPTRGRLLSESGEGRLYGLMEFDRSGYAPIRREVENAGGNVYVQFSRECAALERDRLVMAIRPDLGIEYIPTEILIHAALEADFPTDDNMEFFEELVGIYAARYRNICEKKKYSHHIVSAEGMRRFARTGRIADHFWGLRPFTVQERICILRKLQDWSRNNPYFRLYILKEENFGDHIVYYFEGKGILVIDPKTSYDLSGDYSELLIVHPDILKLYKAYFTGGILKHFVQPAGAEQTLLQELIDYCEEFAED